MRCLQEELSFQVASARAVAETSRRFQRSLYLAAHFFRKHAAAKASDLGLRGWVRNHEDGTRVVGEAEGPAPAIESYRHWLQHTGSPKSAITGASFVEEREVAAFTHGDFAVRR